MQVQAQNPQAQGNPYAGFLLSGAAGVAAGAAGAMTVEKVSDAIGNAKVGMALGVVNTGMDVVKSIGALPKFNDAMDIANGGDLAAAAPTMQHIEELYNGLALVAEGGMKLTSGGITGIQDTVTRRVGTASQSGPVVVRDSNGNLTGLLVLAAGVAGIYWLKKS